MLQIFPDELLHSYILRVIISHGLANRPTDIECIISPAGVVKEYFALTEQQCMIFSAFPVTTLMEFLENHMFVESLRTSNPKCLPARCGRIFFHRQVDVSEEYILDFALNTNSTHTYNLCYCSECIRDQIQEHGCGWFKLSWLISDSCDVHNLELISIKQHVCACKLNILDKVISVLSGVCVFCKCEAQLKLPIKDIEFNWDDKVTLTLTNIYQKIFGVSRTSKVGKTYAENKRVAVSTCFVISFEMWLRDFDQRLEIDIDQYVYFKRLFLDMLDGLTYSNGYPRPVSTGYLLSLLGMFEEKANNYYHDFLDKHTEILNLDCSDCVPAQIFVDFRVAKDRDCVTCRVKRGVCPFKR